MPELACSPASHARANQLPVLLSLQGSSYNLGAARAGLFVQSAILLIKPAGRRRSSAAGGSVASATFTPASRRTSPTHIAQPVLLASRPRRQLTGLDRT